jgi:hypothetical protein
VVPSLYGKSDHHELLFATRVPLAIFNVINIKRGIYSDSASRFSFSRCWLFHVLLVKDNLSATKIGPFSFWYFLYVQLLRSRKQIEPWFYMDLHIPTFAYGFTDKNTNNNKSEKRHQI